MSYCNFSLRDVTPPFLLPPLLPPPNRAHSPQSPHFPYLTPLSRPTPGGWFCCPSSLRSSLAGGPTTAVTFVVVVIVILLWCGLL